jgi:hypothetical protein
VELGPALEEWIDETIRGRFAELVPELEASVADELQRRFARRIEEILGEVQDTAEEVLDRARAISYPTLT